MSGRRPHERASRRPTQESGSDQRGKERLAVGAPELPQKSRLVERQAETGHLEILVANAPEKGVEWRLLHRFRAARGRNSVSDVDAVHALKRSGTTRVRL